uniref:Inactive pancreatic lipase-related protein 1 n=1 Tax=Ceratitis capitata TaxID=7213 RepID=W8AL20_CERCA
MKRRNLLLKLCALLATLSWRVTVCSVVQENHLPAQNDLDAALAESFSNGIANSTDLVRAVRESIRQHELLQQRNKPRRSKRAIKRVCYGELGCFEDSGPFAYLEMLPSPPEDINTKFYFYSTKNRSERPLMELPFLNMTDAFGKIATSSHTIRRRMGFVNETNGGADDATSTTTTTTTTAKTTQRSVFKRTPLTLDELHGFDELSVRVIVHGFGSACPHVWIYEMKTALMAVEDCIVICVDWENGATFPNYVRAAANTRLVGKQLAMLLQNLKEHKGLNFTRTHIIGFSLGAHVSGFAGAELPGLARITGLDPAGPLFEAQHPKVRLDNTDAEFVDVIHSNGENLILGGLGSWQPMGHVDFYPNGGRVQTGCSNLFVGAVTDFIWSAQTADEEEGRSLCNHRRAYKFFIDSVAPRCMFPAYPCNNYDDFIKGDCFPCAQNDDDVAEGVPRCGNMGYYADRSTGRGQLYLLTREEEPFCAHQFKLEIFNSFNDLPLRTIGRLEATLEGEGGLNETFKISEKDDSEFFAGDIVSKIIVPHPALGFPTTLSLHYKSYSGWLSKGLPHWDIDKVVLTDSFGRSHSLCKPSTKLSSGTPVRLKLLSGNCELENQEDYGTYNVPTTLVPDSNGQESVADNVETDSVDAAKQSKDYFNLGTSFRIDQNSTYGDNELPWQPIFEGTNSLDKDVVAESSRSISVEPTEIFEPILNDRRLGLKHARNLQEYGVTTEEIVEPVLKATTPRVKKAKEIVFTDSPLGDKKPEIIKITPISVRNGPELPKQPSKQDEVITVQLLPFRLGDLLQRAERYARETLLPLISVQAPKFFGFNVGGVVGTATTSSSTEEPAALKEEPRKPRYIPRFEEASFLRDKRVERKPVKDLTVSESRTQRNIFKLLRSERREKGEDGGGVGVGVAAGPASTSVSRLGQTRTFSDINYYTNMMLTESRALRPEDPSYEPVFIELPTYRPSKKPKHLVEPQA